MRVLFHKNVGAVFVSRFPKDSPVFKEHGKGGLTNWRAWWFGRFRVMVVKASPHWISG